MNYEIEKKFLIKYPDVSALKNINGCTFSQIEQIYLKCDAGKSERIRKRVTDGKTAYYHTVKKRINAMKRIEEEKTVTEEEYISLKKRADEGRNIIYKTRYCIPYENHILEIDVFPFWKKQAFLEIELDSESEEYKIPDYINIIRDVTQNGEYTNKALAKLIPPED